jgi:hypothetical protein
MFDYNTMELRDFRRDVYLSEGEYAQLLKDGNTVSFDVCYNIMQYYIMENLGSYLMLVI